MTLDQLINQLEPDLAAVFKAAMEDLRNGIDRAALIDALERNDIESAIRALNIEPAVFNQYAQVRASQYAAFGGAVTSMIPSANRFNMANPRAEAWIREQSATRIVGYTEEQVATARRVIFEGYQRGEGPQDIATEIAGRINPLTRRREGGIIGLSDPQAEYVQSMRARLASGDPVEMRKVLGTYKDGKWTPGTGMTLRDRRFDRTIAKAIREEKPIPKKKLDEMVAKYSDRLLAKRARDVARTETAQAVEGAKAESYQQALDKNNMPDDAVTKTWIHAGGREDARAQHLIMHDVSVKGMNAKFTLPDGTQMAHTHDPAGGAKHNANCRCNTRYEIDFARGVL